jgi:hypothetical protein
LDGSIELDVETGCFFAARKVLGDLIGLEGEIAPLQDFAFGCCFLDDIELFQQRFGIVVALLGVLYEVHAEEVAQAGTDVFTAYHVVRSAIGAPGGFCWVGS